MAAKVAALPSGGVKARKPRKSQRVSVSLQGGLFSLEGERTILVLNLCAEGAMIEMTLPPPLGSEVMLHCGGIEAGGSIVWQRSRLCGVRFHAPILESEIDSEVLWSRTTLARLLAH